MKKVKLTLLSFIVVFLIAYLAYAQETKKLAFKDIKPIETSLEVEGIFLLFLDELGKFKVEGKVTVIREGFFVHRGGRFSWMPKGAEFTMVTGGVQIFLPAGADIDWTYSIWLPGTTHEIKGEIVNLGIKGYIFEGDITNPLTFKLIKDIGYMYQKGRGTVTAPDGRIYKLGEE